MKDDGAARCVCEGHGGCGFTCPIAPPVIVVADVPSYGNYDPATNTLMTSAWELLSDDEKGGFFQMLGAGGYGKKPRARSSRLERITGCLCMSWGIGGRACRGISNAGSFYALSLARIAWLRRTGGSMMRRSLRTRRRCLSFCKRTCLTRSPLGRARKGTSMPHYPDKFSSVIEYIWFQARMCLAAFDEKPSPSFAQALKETGAKADSSAAGPSSAAVEATRVKMTALRDAFVKATVDAGFKCSIAPPTIVVVDVPSFGNYEPETNTLKTSAWEQMPKQERGIFYQLAGPGASEEAVRAEFETDAHHWIFVHEMGHWWQACRGRCGSWQSLHD